MKRISTILLLLCICYTAQAQPKEYQHSYFTGGRLRKGVPKYVKRYKELYIKEYGLHILLPQNWMITRMEPGSEYQVQYLIDVHYLAISDSVFKKSIGFSLSVGALARGKYADDTAFYKSFTFADTSVYKHLLSAQFPSTMLADMQEQWRNRLHKWNGTHKVKADFNLALVHNNDVILLSFEAYRRRLRKNIPVFYDVINSIYFDK